MGNDKQSWWRGTVRVSTWGWHRAETGRCGEDGTPCVGWAAGRMARTEGQDLDVSPHPWVPQPPHTPLRSSTGSPDRTGITVPPPQHGKVAPRAWVRDCRAFIHHTTSRHGTGVQDRRAGGPSSGQKVPFMRPWHGLTRGSRRTGQGQAWLCLKHLRIRAGLGTGTWRGQGKRLSGGQG